MPYASGPIFPAPPMVSICTRGIGWADENTLPNAVTSSAFETADMAVYSPVVMPCPFVVRRVWWANGATTSGAATISVGLYADADYGPGAKLVSGSATQGTAVEIQFVDVTDCSCGPGVYWIAIHSTSATNTTLLSSIIQASVHTSYRFQESTVSLPAAATPAASDSAGYRAYLCGFATTSSP